MGILEKTSLVVVLAIVSACSTAPRQVHTGVAIPRTIVPDVHAPLAETKFDYAFGMDGNRAQGLTDAGNRVYATNVGFQFEAFVEGDLALGLRPFYGKIDPDLDASSHLGLEFYARWKFLDSESGRVYLYPSLRYAMNRASDEGQDCEFLFDCEGNGKTSSAKIEILEPGIGFIAERFLAKKHSILVSPNIYFTFVETSNYLIRIKQFGSDDRRFTYSLMGAYSFYAGRKENMALRLGFGMTSHRTVGKAGNIRTFKPIGFIALQVGSK